MLMVVGLMPESHEMAAFSCSLPNLTALSHAAVIVEAP